MVTLSPVEPQSRCDDHQVQNHETMLRQRTNHPVDVLIIEDDPDTCANLSDILELSGEFSVHVAGTVRAALARTDWPRYAAILLDRRLPDGNAQELLPRLKKLAPNAAVVIITGHSDVEGAIEALRLGAVDYILKPVNVDSLRFRLGRIMEERRAREAKERGDAVFRNLVEAAESMIVILRPDHTIAYFSPFAEQLTGFDASEVIDKNYLDLFVAEPDRAFLANVYQRALTGAPSRAVEGRVSRRDGSTRWLLSNVRGLLDYDGEAAVLIVGHDITELIAAQERVLQAERLAAIGHMCAGLAHESRNALQRSQACLEMLALKVEDRPAALDLIARIQSAQDHLYHLYEDVRSYAAPIKLDRHECLLSDVWREAWTHLESARKQQTARLAENLAGADLRCCVDHFRLGQVFRNIFDNALAATRGPVEIELTASPVHLGNQPALRISVQDNGPGLDAEQRARIFESFYTTKTKGTGLGMAIAKRIVEAHGGQITVGDRPGPGAEIILSIPRGIP